jgi:hypothetical protein
VTLTTCYTAVDDLSGIAGYGYNEVNSDDPNFPAASLVLGSGPQPCFDSVVPQFTPYGLFRILGFSGTDQAGNGARFGHPLDPRIDDDLYAIGPCEIENRSGGGLPDADGDGIPDDADNCPDDPNADQADADLDLIGDVCDPYPDEPDHAKAQCFDDLAACESVPTFVDGDGDGEEDSTDWCPNTGVAAVDAAGCSLAQFCAAIDTSTSVGTRTCKASDWRNDEPITTPKDCAVLKQGRGEPSVCVPR